VRLGVFFAENPRKQPDAKELNLTNSESGSDTINKVAVAHLCAKDSCVQAGTVKETVNNTYIKQETEKET